ncbi:MAG TPA: hypothetical protein VNA57_05265 [Acidimicrobiales bacterium]|nr:hypothetical protein [Acidimicrobiales bacterium]
MAFRRTRMLTLTGPPGVGKSRLALSLAWRLLPLYPDGALWVDVRAAAWASAPTQEAPKRLILVLDNCEHALAECADLTGQLLGAWPDATMLVTSREPLGVVAEQTLNLAPLSLPDDDSLAAVQVSDAFHLFCDRATVVQPEFNVDAHAAEIAAICRCLDGIPLAIELAAARADVLSPGQILSRLNDEKLAFLVA